MKQQNTLNKSVTNWNRKNEWKSTVCIIEWIKINTASSDCFHRIVWRPWAKHFIPNVLFALIVEKSLPTLPSTWKTDCPTVKKIGMNCSPPNVSLVVFQSRPVTVGSRLLTTIIIANALIAHYAKRTSREKDSLSRLANRFAKAMPGWESDQIEDQDGSNQISQICT